MKSKNKMFLLHYTPHHHHFLLLSTSHFLQFRTWPLYHGTRFNKEVNSTQKPNNWIIWCGSIFKINFMPGNVFISQGNYSFFPFASSTNEKKNNDEEMKQKTTDINAIIFITSFLCLEKCSTNFTSSCRRVHKLRAKISFNKTFDLHLFGYFFIVFGVSWNYFLLWPF